MNLRVPQAKPTHHLAIPHPGGTLLATVGYLLGTLFVVAAVYNIAHPTSISIASGVASVFWLGLVTLIILTSVSRDGGVRQYLVNRMGKYARQQHVRAWTVSGDVPTIAVGYTLFGRDFAYLTLAADKVLSVDCTAGQATAMAGRDMNDWHVALWYRDPQGTRWRHVPHMDDKDLIILGPRGSRKSVEIFGGQLVQFLKDVGIDLVPGENNRQFVPRASSGSNS